jgi:hypothetical protein
MQLTKQIAPIYNEYGEGFSSTKLAKEFELESITQLIESVDNK